MHRGVVTTIGGATKTIRFVSFTEAKACFIKVGAAAGCYRGMNYVFIRTVSSGIYMMDLIRKLSGL